MRVTNTPAIPHASHSMPPPTGPKTSPASSPTSMRPIIWARWLFLRPEMSALRAPHAGRKPALPPSSSSLPAVNPKPFGASRYRSDEPAFAALRTTTVGFLPNRSESQPNSGPASSMTTAEAR